MSIVSDNNLKNSLTQVKGKTDEEFSSIDSRLEKLNYVQKVLKDGDAKYLFGTSISTWNTSTGNTTFSANTSFLSVFNLIDTNAEGYISLENGVLTLRKGLTYKIEMHIFSNSNSGAFILIDKDQSSISSIWSTSYTDSTKPWYGNAGRLSTSSFSNTPVSAVIDATDGEKNLIAVLSDSCSIWNHYSYFFVQVLNPCVADPVEYTNNKDGLEDTPVGHIISYMGNTAPKHYLFCDGTEYNVEDYKYLAKHFEDEFGSVNYFGGDGTTTFAVPDLRGEFLRGTGNNGSDVGEHQDATNIPRITLTANNMVAAKATYDTSNLEDTQIYTGTTKTNTTSSFTTGENGVLGGAVRPTNTSVLYCIKYEPTYYMSIEGKDIYSTEERIVGYWLDEKPIYQKTIEFGALPNTSAKTVSAGLQNPDMIISIDGITYNSTTDDSQTIPYVNPAGAVYGIALWYTRKTDLITIRTGSNRSQYLETYITMRYTKTTD